jgi:filamentous hemagglutinin
MFGYTASGMCTTGLGCVANAFVVGTTDVLIAGAKQTVSGQPESPYLNQALTSLGLSPGAASLLEAGWDWAVQ